MGSSPQKKRNAPGGMGGMRLGSWGPAEFGRLARGFGVSAAGWHAALELEVRGVLDGWHAALAGARGVWVGGTGAALELGLAQFGWAARGSGAGGCMEFGWVAGPRAHGSGAGGPQSLDGWHAAQELEELGARGVWRVARGFGAGRLRF